MTNTLFTCCFCGHKITFKESHNAEPVVEKGRCCEDCHTRRVMPVRCASFLHAVYRA